jgi:hypothetical protein
VRVACFGKGIFFSWLRMVSCLWIKVLSISLTVGVFFVLVGNVIFMWLKMVSDLRDKLFGFFHTFLSV